MNKSVPDSGIPILTEIIQVAPHAATVPVAIPTLTESFIPNTTKTIAEPVAAAEAAPVEMTPAEPAPIDSQLDEAPIDVQLNEKWSRLEQEITERVLAQLLDRIDTVLEQRIKDSLAASLQLAVDEIRQGLQITLDDVISDTVAQEIDNLRFSKK